MADVFVTLKLTTREFDTLRKGLTLAIIESHSMSIDPTIAPEDRRSVREAEAAYKQLISKLNS